MTGDTPKRAPRASLKTHIKSDLPLDSSLKSRAPATTKTNALNARAYRPFLLQEGGKYKAERLKKTKFSLLNEQKQKAKKTGLRHSDSLTDSPEVQLLIKLFIPSKFLIKNDKLSMKQLSAHLPALISESMPKLNLELHLFLSTVVSRYVSSWYLGKLNTQNLDFVHQVYQILCDVIKSIAKRISNICNGPALVDLVDKCAYDINNHITALATSIRDKEDLRILTTAAKTKPGMLYNAKAQEKETIRSFLAASHVIFDEELNSGPHNDENDTYVEEPEDPELVYLRILTRKVLLATFDDDTSAGVSGPGITNSVITMNLVTFLVADLVLEKTLGKLSSPKFICSDVIGNIVRIANGALEAKPTKSTPVSETLTDRIKGTMYKGYKGVVSTVVAISSTFATKSEDNASAMVAILDLSVFALLDTVMGISQRKPLAAYLVRSVRALISVSGPLSRRVDSFLMGFLESKVSRLSILRDSQVARVVRELRSLLFDDSRKEETSEDKNITIENITEEMFLLLTRLPNPALSHLFRYQDESDAELREAIRKGLVVFNYSATCENDKLHESSDLNRLLVVKLLDRVMGKLYPELLA